MRLDAEEAIYQEQKRKEAIEHANRLLFYENDQVKTFQSQVLLSDVLKVHCSSLLLYLLLSLCIIANTGL